MSDSNSEASGSGGATKKPQAGESGAAGSNGEAGAGEAAGSSSAGSLAKCVPQCGDRECGPDPVCETSCGTCDAGRECSAGICKAPEPLKENGATCTRGAECASGICDQNQVGESHCYGTALPNEICGDTFDCRAGVCVTRALGGAQKVCVDGILACDALNLTGTCTEALAIVTCQFDEYCGDTPGGDFNACIEFGCKYWHDNPPPSGCQSQFNFIANGQASCQ